MRRARTTPDAGSRWTSSWGTQEALILIGPSLKSADQAVRYACRYTKRPVIAEGRIIKFAQGHVTFRFKDYHQDRKIRVRKLPVLTFIDRLVQHLPEVGFRQVRH